MGADLGAPRPRQLPSSPFPRAWGRGGISARGKLSELRGVRPGEGPEGTGRVADEEGRESLVQSGSGAAPAKVSTPPVPLLAAGMSSSAPRPLLKLMALTKPCWGMAGWVLQMTCALGEGDTGEVVRGECHTPERRSPEC